MTFKIEVTRKDAPKLLDWLTSRGGIAIWESLDLARAGQRSFTPADNPSPGWQFGSKPAEIVTDRTDVGVYDETLYKAFPVSCRLGSNGLTLKLTDPSQRKLDKVMQECADKHGNSHYRKGVLEDKAYSMGVYYSTESVPL